MDPKKIISIKYKETVDLIYKKYKEKNIQKIFQRKEDWALVINVITVH